MSKRVAKLGREYKKNIDKIVTREFYLSPEDQLIYIYKRKDYHNISEVINVCYNIRIDSDWITIIRYDSSHGYLHVHSLVTLHDRKEVITKIDTPGSHNKWLSWAVADISTNYILYKNTFFERNKVEA